MTVTNQDVCEFFGFSEGLNLELPGTMVMMLVALKEKKVPWALSYDDRGCEFTIYLDDEWDNYILRFADTFPLAVLEAVRQLIRKERV